MPFMIRSRCGKCGEGDDFGIGNWPEHLGVFVCRSCRALVNIPIDTGKCPGCGHEPQPAEMYDYSFAIPYLGGQTVGSLEPGPTCPKCSGAALAFDNRGHVNMGVVVHNEEKARATCGRDFMEKAIFMNTAVLVCHQHQLSPGKMFDYFHLDVPSRPPITGRVSEAILADIAAHVGIRMQIEPELFTGQHPNDGTIRDALYGQLVMRSAEGVVVHLFERAGQRATAQRRWWQFWRKA